MRRALVRRAGLAALTVLGALLAPVGSASAGAAAEECPAGHVALTFDDGPGPGTDELLAALATRDARATFFLVGARARQEPATTRRIVEQGHAVGNHSWSHPFLDELAPRAAYDELLGTNQVLRDLTGAAPTLFRPPFGRTNGEIRGYAEELGATEVLWTIDTRDWDGATTDEVVASVAGAVDGDVVLLHDAGHPATVEALPRILDDLRERGLCPGRVERTATEQVAWPGQTFAARVVAW